MTRSAVLVVASAVATVSLTGAQQIQFAYPVPGENSYKVIKGVEYGTSASGPLRMDVYRPATGTRHPTLIFFSVASGAERSNPFYASWARVAASQGVTAILPDLRMETAVQDYVALHEYLAKYTGEETGIDRDAVALYAGSGNVSRALPIVQDRRSTLIKSAVMYYGSASVTKFREDLPVLYVRAGLDRPPVNREIDSIVANALSQNAPVTLLNYAGGYHAFEIRNDDEQTRKVIDQTLEFVKTTTKPGYQAALRRSARESIAAGHMTSERFHEAAAIYAELVAAAPDNHTLRLARGEALLADKQFAAACAELEKLRGKGLGYRDLGIPAARACMQNGDGDAAIAWLQSIPVRFRPMELADDPIFAPIKDRAEFKALFEGR